MTSKLPTQPQPPPRQSRANAMPSAIGLDALKYPMDPCGVKKDYTCRRLCEMIGPSSWVDRPRDQKSVVGLDSKPEALMLGPPPFD